MKKLSIVVPAFNEETCISPFIAAIDGLKLAADVEFVFVDDGSSDGTLDAIKAAAEGDGRVRYVSFSRNFGKEAALFAGLEHATGDYTVTMDADLQHDPKLLPEMFAALESGEFDSAAVCRTARKDEPKLRGYLAGKYYSVMNRYSEVSLRDGSMDYRMMTREFVQAVLSLKERGRFTKGIYQWVGFRTKWIETETIARVSGVSKWNLEALFAYAINSIIAFSNAPLKIASVTGVFACAGAVLYALFVLLAWLFAGGHVSSVMVLACVVVFLGGLQLFVIGILGLYVSGIFRETKNRPLFIVKEAR